MPDAGVTSWRPGRRNTGTENHGRERVDSRFAWFATSLTHPDPLRTSLPRLGRLTASSGGPDRRMQANCCGRCADRCPWNCLPRVVARADVTSVDDRFYPCGRASELLAAELAASRYRDFSYRSSSCPDLPNWPLRRSWPCVYGDLGQVEGAKLYPVLVPGVQPGDRHVAGHTRRRLQHASRRHQQHGVLVEFLPLGGP